MSNNGQSVEDGTRQLGLKSKTPSSTPDGVKGTPKGERTYTQAEFSAQQSTYEQKLQQLKAEYATTKTAFEALQRSNARATAELEVLRDEAKNPYADDEGKSAAEKIRAKEVRLKSEAAELAVIQEQFKGTLEEAKQTKVGKWAQEVSEWTLGKVDPKDLIGYGTKAEMLEHVHSNLDLKTIADLQGEGKGKAPEKEMQPRVRGSDNPQGGGEHLSAHEKIVRGLDAEKNE